MTELRNTSFSGNAADDALRSAENARDANTALAERVLGYVVGPTLYTAAGATTSTMGVACLRQPKGVLLLNAALNTDPASDLGAVSRCNFQWDSATNTANVFEPSGLTAGSVYSITFLVVG